MKRISVLLLFIAVLFVAIFPVVSADEPKDYDFVCTVEGSSSVVQTKNGKTFTVEVSVPTNAGNVKRAIVKVSYNAELVSYVSADTSKSAFLTGADGESLVARHIADKSEVWITLGDFLSDVTYNQTGLLVVLTFEADDTADTTVAFNATLEAYDAAFDELDSAVSGSSEIKVVGKDHGHDWTVEAAVDPTCTEPGKTEGKYCSFCEEGTTSEEVPALGHDPYTSKEAKAATETEDGYTAEIKCRRCGVTLQESEPVPATGSTTTEKTPSYLWILWVVLAVVVVAVVAVAVIFIVKKKKKA